MVQHINVQITNRQRTQEWYANVLGARFRDRGPERNKRQLQLHLGNAEMHFTETDTPMIPARTHFHFHALRCDARFTAANVNAALSKGPHIVLFGSFFLLTAAQFDRIDRRSMAWSLAATLVLGTVVEIEEGLTRTGNCRYTDVLPDLFGGLLVMAALMSAALLWRRRRPNQASTRDVAS